MTRLLIHALAVASSTLIFAAAAMLAHNGFARNVRGAIFSYNHAGWYVDMVLQQAVAYGWRQ
ncbi:MAG TPA: hypothetical protein VIN56_02310 [Candidatus Dormibacteraeota bacterium]|jgi:N-acetylneuraminic acid mutarotase